MICTCSMHCTRSGYHERACCEGPICACWCHDRASVHVPAGPNEPAGYVRCLPSGAVHPAEYDCQKQQAAGATPRP